VSQALQKVAERESETEQKYTEQDNENGIESEDDVPEFFFELESKVKKTVLQFETVQDEVSKCSACSSTKKCFYDSQQLIEFDAQYSNVWSCDMCGKESRENVNLFPMHHCTVCKQDQCRRCIPSLEYCSLKNESKVKNQDLDSRNQNVGKDNFDMTEAMDSMNKENGELYKKYYSKKRKRDSEESSEDDNQRRKL